jgi:hypothetical protein
VDEKALIVAVGHVGFAGAVMDEALSAGRSRAAILRPRIL